MKSGLNITAPRHGHGPAVPTAYVSKRKGLVLLLCVCGGGGRKPWQYNTKSSISRVFPKFYKSPYLDRKNGDQQQPSTSVPSRTAELLSDSSFDESEPLQRVPFEASLPIGDHERPPDTHLGGEEAREPMEEIVEETLEETAEENMEELSQEERLIARRRKASIIDGAELERYIYDVIQVSLLRLDTCGRLFATPADASIFWPPIRFVPRILFKMNNFASPMNLSSYVFACLFTEPSYMLMLRLRL